ncbi:MAG: acyl-CoA thioesterase [Firmicutes bacterium]|nr:acyl-CoA thioesterase [Bacillota bacterium]
MGVVYHSNYFIWFEMGRAELFRDQGFPYRNFEKAGFAVPVKEVNCTYLKPALYDDLLTVETFVAKLTPVRMEFTYNIKRGAELLAQGRTFHAIVDKSGRPCNLKKKAPGLWEKLKAIETSTTKEEK